MKKPIQLKGMSKKIKLSYNINDFTYQIYTFPNGIRLVYSPTSSPITYTGFFINTGSREEQPHEHGIAHLIEHVVFKGTEKRKSHQILSRMENVGGEINAYTTKEETCVHAAFMNEYLERAWELIHDIIFHSTFPEKEIDKEKSVIVDEINSFKDNPAELIYEEFDQLLFKGSTLGRNILGTPTSLKKITRNHILHFIENNYHTDQMVISVRGNYSFKKIIKLAEKYFAPIPLKKRNFHRQKPTGVDPFTLKKKHNLNQAHCVTGTHSYGFNDPKRLTLLLINDLLGGPGMNSRLNMTLREKKALAYNIESSQVSFSDCGIFTIYFGCDSQRVEQCLSLIYKEFEKLRSQKLSYLQLNIAKRQIMGQLAISAENGENIMLSMGKSILTYNHFDTLADIAKKLEQIEASHILEIANEVLDPKRLSTLIYL